MNGRVKRFIYKIIEICELGYPHLSNILLVHGFDLDFYSDSHFERY